jgi:hypothetical protein
MNDAISRDNPKLLWLLSQDSQNLDSKFMKFYFCEEEYWKKILSFQKEIDCSPKIVPKAGKKYDLKTWNQPYRLWRPELKNRCFGMIPVFCSHVLLYKCERLMRLSASFSTLNLYLETIKSKSMRQIISSTY